MTLVTLLPRCYLPAQLVALLVKIVTLLGLIIAFFVPVVVTLLAQVVTPQIKVFSVLTQVIFFLALRVVSILAMW